MTIKTRAAFELRQVYGKDTLYPADATAAALCELAGTKTLVPAMVAPLRRLGFEIVTVQPAVFFNS